MLNQNPEQQARDVIDMQLGIDGFREIILTLKQN